MSWAEIKKSVNSTLGTSGAMPLDKIVKQEASNLKNGLKNGTLIPQKSEILTDDWQDVELTFVESSIVGDHYETNVRVDPGVYIAIANDYYIFLILILANKDNSSTIIDDKYLPQRVFLEYSTHSGTYQKTDWVSVVKRRLDSTASFEFVSLESFRLKKII